MMVVFLWFRPNEDISGDLDVRLLVAPADGTNDLTITSHDDGTNGLILGSTLVTASAAELNILDGVTVTAGQINNTVTTHTAAAPSAAAAAPAPAARLTTTTTEASRGAAA